MKIFFNRVPRNEPYGGGNQFLVKIVEKLQKEGHNVVFYFEPEIDLMFIMDPRPGDIGYSAEHIAAYKNKFPNTKIIHRINECDKRKDTDFIDNMLIKTASLADKVVFISQWLSDYFYAAGFEGNSSVIYNGCDKENFKPLENKNINYKKLGLVTHHWSDNWMKGFDLYTEIDKYLDENDADFDFTYIGRYCKEYKPKATNIVSPLHGKSLADELKKYDIYITASRWEPCGMHHIEGAAVGLPIIYHEDTGGIVELCKNHGLSYRTFEDFLASVENIKDNYNSFVDSINHDFLDIDRCCDEYYNIILETVEDS